MSFQFFHPFWAFALLLLPLLWLFPKARRVVYYSHLGFLKTLSHSPKVWVKALLFWLRVLGFVALVLAMMRPQLVDQTSQVEAEGIDILLVMDTSLSMRALDFFIERQRVTRLEAVKKVVYDFVKKRKYDRIGVVIFGEVAFLQCPLTLDHDMVKEVINQMSFDDVGEKGTVIGDGLALALKSLKDSETKSKIVILLTDGFNTGGQITPLGATSIAKELGIKVYTVGVGTEGMVPIKLPDPFGFERVVYRNIPIDLELLRQIAAQTQGKAYRAEDSSQLSQIYDQIDLLEKTKIKMDHYQNITEIFSYFLWAAFALFLLEFCLAFLWLKER